MELLPLPTQADPDVVVIGAGLSGLRAATKLHASGVSVMVVEARDRVGGRLLTQEVAGSTLDLGAQWTGPTQDRIRALCTELGIQTFPTHHTGRKVLQIDGAISSYEGDIPSLPPLSLLALHRLMGRIDKAVQEVPAKDAYTLPDSAGIDGLSVANWCDRHAKNRRVRALVEVTTRVVFGAEPTELSMLHFLAYLNAGGGLSRLIEIADGAQQDRFIGGAQQLAEGMAHRLSERVLLGAPVHRIAQTSTEVMVYTQRGAIRTGRVIITVPPALVQRIAFEPVLPTGRAILQQRMPMGATIKVIARYATPFWREHGFSGEVVCSDGPLTVVFDNTDSDGSASLLGFIVGRHAREWGSRSAQARQQAVLSSLTSWFGEAAGTPLAYAEKDWSDDVWTRGCPIGFAGPDVLSVHGDHLREPFGRFHWAGTETATEWTGFMEGALQSGDRAAAEVLSAG